uniref:Carbamoyl-phosphate synthase large chain n=1 Tax=Anthurium amnicola TaxID=1678845 RepID=A0A1D1ZE06_9ARAE
MGNHASCAPYIVSGGRAVKVVHDDGRVAAYTRPVRAAELMAENPWQFVCDAGDLRVGHRVPGLAAEVELERHRLYFLLPVDMLYSVLTEEEMASLCRAAGATKRRIASAGSIRKMIFPVLGDSCMFPSEVQKPPAVRKVEEGVGRVARQRSWQPSLDTIHETTCHS